MKKLSKIIGLTFIFIFISLFLLDFAQAAIVWEYTQGPITSTPQFPTEEACNTHRTSFLSNPVFTATPCESITSLDGPTIDDSDPVIIDPQSGSTNDDNGIYKLLAPIGNLVQAPDNVGDYFNIIFKLAIGLCAVLAVVMIVIGGVQYMGNESIFGKTEAKSRITAAILGLLIALSSYALLNTINPDLLGGKGVIIEQVKAEIVDLPDAGDDNVDPDFNKNTGSYSVGTASSGVTEAISKITQEGRIISGFTVFKKTNRMAIHLKKGNDNIYTYIDMRPGSNGYANEGQGSVGDRKTPIGTWKILNIKTPGNGIPIYNKKGSNMGPSFWLLSPTTNGERGIGMHGNKTGTLTTTAGCIRLKNADILALLPYVKTGIPVFIVNK